MTSARASKIASEIGSKGTKLGDIKKVAKEIKKDHELAMELWSTGEFRPRLLSTLIFDKKRLSQAAIELLVVDMLDHDESERNQLSEWLMANQLMKDKNTVVLMGTWEEHPSSTLRRLFWYHQARLRWTGQTPPDNTSELLDSIERKLGTAPPDVQWAMNFCAGQIGVHDPTYRSRCIGLGENLGLYKDEPVARHCTPSYLPEFIRIEVAKRAK